MASFELHVSRAARERYRLDGRLFGISGNLVFADFRAARQLAQRMSENRGPDAAVHAGELNALGVIDEVLHHVVDLYRQQRDPAVWRRALGALEQRVGSEAVDATLREFITRFPPSPVASGRLGPDAYLEAETDGLLHRHIALEELLFVWLANANPAVGELRELFADAELRDSSDYDRLISGMVAFFADEPPFGPHDEPLVAMLRSPAMASPDSLSGQLRFIRERWGLLVTALGDRLAISLDVLEEEQIGRWRRLHPAEAGAGVPPPPSAGYAGLDAEAERFSVDRDWMPRLVLIAKSTFVWLDQLSRQYERPIERLDQIPDGELDRLARSGFSGLWLIGLWERSRASQRIKQLRGNPEAVASAYSLDEYRIADELGGDLAYADLRDRAAQRGIRLASDMVPNHMGIDSAWVMDHPGWFIGLDHPPYPAYTFTGPDLSPRRGVGIVLEDHYYDGTDAAVVFKRTDDRGERYIYHGNDGTSTPWNDTAQLDYLNPEVRDAVIQTILEVARRFPVIRFDAAMTLARRHVQRLWYPEPGSGGTAIPSRSEYGALSGEEFARRMPAEFWREVVDRVAAEVPDTLLLAEAFWMMEGYFVRTLGMHRVYNSAFMHMLRDEKNAEYRALIRQTLDFDPEILKRYVNFMNNPDEKTAVEQFGKGDKYFGIATVMATLPGLPMFGHGQVEGYAEKYGMEFRRAYWDEQPDPWLVERHEREIFPLLHRRAAFAEVRDFLLYDLAADGGEVDENVFAYSNRSAGERTLVIYHNRYGSTSGWIRDSVPYAVKHADRTERVRRTLADGLDLTDAPDRFLILRDLRTGLEYLRESASIRRAGLWFSLGAYACHVFSNFREVADPAGLYQRLADRLDGGGVPSIDAALRELELEPLHAALRAVLEPGELEDLAAGGRFEPGRFTERLRALIELVVERTGGELDDEAIRSTSHLVAGALELPELKARRPRPGEALPRALAGAISSALPRASLDELRLEPVLAAGLRGLGIDEGAAWRSAEAGRLLTELPPLPPRARIGSASVELWRRWMAEPRVRRFLGVNRHDGVEWFNCESLDELLWWIGVRPRLTGASEAEVERMTVVAGRVRAAAGAASYRVDAMVEALGEAGAAPRRRRGRGSTSGSKRARRRTP